MCCEYKDECGYADENACKYEGCFQDCALWRYFVVREKLNRQRTRLSAVASDKGQINFPELKPITRKVRQIDMEVFK